MSRRQVVGVVSLTVFGVLAAAAHRPSNAREAHATHASYAAQSVVPPAFGVVPVAAGQTLRATVACYAHQVGLIPPDPCRGTIMLHDAAGNVVKQGTYDLKPGEVGGLSFTFTPIETNLPGPILINPCWLPAAGGRGVPSVEVFNSDGRVVRFVNPAAGRITDMSNGALLDPGSLVGFNPQPDPPGFGFIAFSSDQALRMHVSCFAHPVGASTLPPPCRGTVMFHDASGNMVQSSTVSLKPGEVATIVLLKTPPDPSFRGAVGINPCWIPSPGGRAVPVVEITDANGQTSQLINPAVARLSDLDQ